MTDLIHLTPYEPQPDLGTPPPGVASEAIRLLVDGRSVEVPAGTSVMRALEALGTASLHQLHRRPGFTAPPCCEFCSPSNSRNWSAGALATGFTATPSACAA